jgi:hypothetical protein
MTYRPLCDVWLLTRCKYKGGVKRFGGYLGGFPERARVMLGATITEPVLHVCGGLARAYPYKGGFGENDKTLDLDPNTHPDFLADARHSYPAGFKAILADPPYSEDDAKHYWPGADKYPLPNTILRRAFEALPIGGRVGIIHYIVPSPPKPSRFVAVVGIVSGFNNRGRMFSVFEKTQ